MSSERKPQRLCKTFYCLIWLGFLATPATLSQQAQGQPWVLAQANIPSAGTVLGWELNMNRIYTPQLDPSVPATQTKSGQEAPVIFYELKNWPTQPSPQDSPYLLNTPGTRK